MSFRKRTLFACAAAIATMAISLDAAAAATPAEVHPGMQVVDPSGGAVGTVAAINGDNLVLKTSKHEVALPTASFTVDQGKLIFGMTAAQLDAAADQQAAASSAAVVAGAQVFGSDGSAAGTVEAVDDSFVTIKLTGGQLVRLARGSVSGSDKGVLLGMTTAKLIEMAAQAAPEPAPQSDGQ
jgi:hypothetical protein